jgi:hypothetical protein
MFTLVRSVLNPRAAGTFFAVQLSLFGAFLPTLTAQASTIIARPIFDGDVRVAANGATSSFNGIDIIMNAQNLPQNAQRRAIMEFDLLNTFQSTTAFLGTPPIRGQQVVSANLQLSINGIFSGTGTGRYELFGFLGDGDLTAADGRNTPDRTALGSFSITLPPPPETFQDRPDQLINITIDPLWLQSVFRQAPDPFDGSIRDVFFAGFQVRPTAGAPRLAINTFNFPTSSFESFPSRPSGPTLSVTFAPINTPASLGMMAGGLLTLYALQRRRKTSPKPL